VSEPGATPVIELTGITKVYGSGGVAVPALRGVSLVIRDGEFVAIMGPSGSGKTTLLGIIGCLDRPTEGTYHLVGTEMSALDETRRARIRGERIGFVFQAYNLLPRRPAYNNVELPLIYAGVPARDRRARVREALGQVGLADRMYHRPNQLSGGQQQRVGIARALVVRPSVLLADEPTGNLDSTNEEEVLGLLERLNENGTTVVLVTHSEEVAERASRIVRIADGVVVADERVERAVEVELAG
jgi:putative ABC transport system ATP-binding protein